MLLADLGSRFVFRPAALWSASFTNRMALLLAPAVLLAAANRPTHRISSPNLDFAAFVLVCVGMLYLAEAVESASSPPRSSRPAPRSRPQRRHALSTGS